MVNESKIESRKEFRRYSQSEGSSSEGFEKSCSSIQSIMAISGQGSNGISNFISMCSNVDPVSVKKLDD